MVFKNKAAFSFNKGLLILIGIVLLSFISGCQQASTTTMSSIDATTPGVFNHYFVYPFSVLLKTFASWFNGSYGLSIIMVTLLVRTLLMPFMLKQTKSQMVMKEKMALVQPELKVIQEKMKKAVNPEEKAKVQKEMLELYQKHGINPLATVGGCLPLLLQMPILMGFYYAIRRTPEIASHSFLWFNLGHSDVLLAILAGAVYFIQYKLSLVNMPEEQRKQMAAIGYISPLMMGIFSLSAPAALPLYWVVGGLFLMLQTYIGKRLYQSKKPVEQVNM
ncbi:membrane protein insertase YidC [Peribacillus tepidiphilus]|uniref:membrane protein insertase YidC n=1 Tax=Peribacillus tepidiphilus TaxID=2652445 RepID=UPI001291CC7B|nr:membrane protein insertase YidC [Peribacillus tepidiphilus]